MVPNNKKLGQAMKPTDNRNYDKPWLVPKKEKKDAETFLEFVYPDGLGPDAELI